MNGYDYEAIGWACALEAARDHGHASVAWVDDQGRPKRALAAELVVTDWRQLGSPGSIYPTDLGLVVAGDGLRTGAVLRVTIEMDQDTGRRIFEAWRKYAAYIVVRLQPWVE